MQPTPPEEPPKKKCISFVARSPAALQPLENDPLLDPLRADPRLAELVQRAAARVESKS